MNNTGHIPSVAGAGHMGKRVKIVKVPQALLDDLKKKAKEAVYVPLESDPEVAQMIRVGESRKAAGKKPKRKSLPTIEILIASDAPPFEREEDDDPHRYPPDRYPSTLNGKPFAVESCD
jgi:hypothetical protein